MRIALFTDTYLPEINGVATSVNSLYNTLKDHGHDVMIVTTNPYSDEPEYKKDVLRVPGITLKTMYDYKLANPLNTKVTKRIEDEIKEFKPDIIHLNTEFGINIIGYSIASDYNIPIVYTYHTMWEEYVEYVMKDNFNRAGRAIMRWYSTRLINKSSEFIAPSIKTKDYMRSIGFTKYINIIPTGLDFERFKKENIDSKKLKDLKKSLGLKNEIVFIYLGRISHEKSIDYSIKCYAKFLKAHPKYNTKFLIVGGGPSIPYLIKLSKTLHISNKVIFTGPVFSELTPYYYHLSDYFISSSLSETQGLTYIESMACGLINLSRFDNNLLDVIIDKKTGFYFKDENDFVNVLYTILNLSKTKQEEIKNNAFSLIDNFSISKFYNRIMTVYNRAIKKNW